MGEEFSGAGVVVEAGAGFIAHGAVDCVFHPVEGGFHGGAGIVGVAVGEAFVPIESGGHGEDVAEGDAAFAIVEVGNFSGVEEFEEGGVEGGEDALGGGDSDDGGGDGFGDGLESMEIAASPVVRVPEGVEVIVGAAEIMGVEGGGSLGGFGVDFGVVARVRAVEGDFAVAENKEAVDVVELAGYDVGVEGGEDGGVEAEGSWCGGGEGGLLREGGEGEEEGGE